MSRKNLERLALAYCLLVLGAAGWFWARQVGSVLELLRLAYG